MVLNEYKKAILQFNTNGRKMDKKLNTLYSFEMHEKLAFVNNIKPLCKS